MHGRNRCRAFLVHISLNGRLNLLLSQRLDSLLHPSQLMSAFSSLPYPVLLDGSMPESPKSRFSYLTADPFLVVRSNGLIVEIQRDGITEYLNGNPWEILKKLLQDYKIERVPEFAPFQGGVIGYWGYDLGRHIEHIPVIAQSDTPVPEMYLGFYDWVLSYDGLTEESRIISTGLPDSTESKARARLTEMLDRVQSISIVEMPRVPGANIWLESNETMKSYVRSVNKIKEYLEAGDVYQVNLSQRFHSSFDGDAWFLYESLRKENPSPFGAYLGFPEIQVLSASPEEFLRLEGRDVTTRPIKGTRPSGYGPEDDAYQSAALLASEKDRAENLMIVDLLRNDLGKVCSVGSVKVPRLFDVERHPTVTHLVSTVVGQLGSDLTAIDLLRACFPGGSVTGAPKIRAMEIIEELEPVRRGVYCGAIGYISFSGDMATSIAIRSLIITGGSIYLQVGGAVVADSVPQSEYQETLDKGRGLFNALKAIS